MAPRKASRGTGKSTPKKRVAASGFKLPDPIPAGQVITDMAKNDWVLGKSIGQGGFGEIYLASNDPSRAVRDTDKYVVKVEPHTNGPLFTEMHCYMRIAKPDLIDTWMKEHKLKRFGMPKYLGSGSFEYKNQKYRFMVMERFGSDLQKILEKHNHKFSFKTVYQVGIEIIDVLEYIHDKGYIHADIKASNLLVGYQKGTENQVFLVDYGLACRYAIDGVHKEYKYDGRKAHDGTIEFTSRDAHIGAHSRRGDLEILSYNLAQWLCARLPWEDNLPDCDYVAKSKRWYMDNVDKFIDKCFPDVIPAGLQEFMTYVASLTFDEKPDYEKCRNILRRGLVTRGYKDDGKLVFMSATPKPVKKSKSRINKRGVKRRRSEEEENLGMTPRKMIRTSPRSPCKSTTNRINTRLCPRKSLIGLSLSTVALPKVMQYTDPEDIIIEKENEKMIERRLRRRQSQVDLDERGNKKKDTSLDNPTPQMLDLMAKRREKSLSPPICQKRHKHRLNCVTNSSGKSSPTTFDEPPTDLTPAMEAVLRRQKERLAEEKLQPTSIDDGEDSDAAQDKDRMASEKYTTSRTDTKSNTTTCDKTNTTTNDKISRISNDKTNRTGSDVKYIESISTDDSDDDDDDDSEDEDIIINICDRSSVIIEENSNEAFFPEDDSTNSPPTASVMTTSNNTIKLASSAVKRKLTRSCRKQGRTMWCSSKREDKPVRRSTSNVIDRASSTRAESCETNSSSIEQDSKNSGTPRRSSTRNVGGRFKQALKHLRQKKKTVFPVQLDRSVIY